MISRWIGHAYDPTGNLGVLAFRFTFEVASSKTIRISADQRYKLYLNGDVVGFGPQRGDAQHWFYDTYDLALAEGENELFVLVWNFGWMAPMAQHTVRTAFMVDSDDPALCTPGAWEVARVQGWSFDMMHAGIGEFYIDVGPGEIIRGDCLEGLEWRKPHVICAAERRGENGGGTPWMLIPRSIPPMRYEVRADVPLELPLRFRGSLLVDYGELLCAYPRVGLRGPEGAVVTATYAEALWDEQGGKGNRNETAGKNIQGYQDRFVLGRPREGSVTPSGSELVPLKSEQGDAQTWVFEPLWWRTYRFLQLDADQEVELVSLDAIETGYPLQIESSFESSDSSTKPIWDVSVRTAERCAGETYFDCPYYEQLQYAGDTRIQTLIGYYLGRDRKLQRNAIDNFAWSVMENGLTQSRYPSRQTQVIPPFTEWWKLMVVDSFYYDRVEGERLEEWAKIARACSSRNAGSDFWHFLDWVPGWRWGVPPGGVDATAHELTRAYVDLMMSQMSGVAGKPLGGLGKEGNLVRWDRDPDWKPSEHTEALYRLCQIAQGQDPDPWPEQELETAKAAKCTYYFSYYKHMAMRPEDYMKHLEPWREMIENGLTTFAENPEPTRSDCHAWSAHPILGFFQLVAGVTSSARGWTGVSIEPRPGSLRQFNAEIAHPDGLIKVHYDNNRLEIETPVPANLKWQEKSQKLEPGSYRF